jgi:hypothetical protein
VSASAASTQEPTITSPSRSTRRSYSVQSSRGCPRRTSSQRKQLAAASPALNPVQREVSGAEAYRSTNRRPSRRRHLAPPRPPSSTPRDAAAPHAAAGANLNRCHRLHQAGVRCQPPLTPCRRQGSHEIETARSASKAIKRRSSRLRENRPRTLERRRVRPVPGASASQMPIRQRRRRTGAPNAPG